MLASCWGGTKNIQQTPHMTYQAQPELLNSLLQLINEHRTEGFAEGTRLLVNGAMRHERAQVPNAQPYERTESPNGYSNGYKSKSVDTRDDLITFDIPQLRGEASFYPSAPHNGVRSEQALKLALEELYVQGVSARNVAGIAEKLCGTSVSSTRVSRCAAPARR